MWTCRQEKKVGNSEGVDLGPGGLLVYILKCTGYDLEANLALLKLYQFNPTHNNLASVVQVSIVKYYSGGTGQY